MSDKEILEKLLEFAPFLSIQNMIKDIGRAVLYWISSVLMWIVEKVGGVLTEMVSVLGFYNATDMTGKGGILETFSAFQKFGIGITLLIIGAVLFLGKTEETRAVPLNALLMVVIVMLLPSIMSDGIKIVNSTVEWGYYEHPTDPEKTGWQYMAKFKQSAIKSTRRTFVNTLLKNETQFKELSQSIQQQVTLAKENRSEFLAGRYETLATDLLQALPDNKYFWKYGFAQRHGFKEPLDRMVNLFLNTDGKETMEKVVRLLKPISDEYESAYGNPRNAPTYYENQLYGKNGLYAQIGNQILHEVRTFAKSQQMQKAVGNMTAEEFDALQKEQAVLPIDLGSSTEQDFISPEMEDVFHLLNEIPPPVEEDEIEQPFIEKSPEVKSDSIPTERSNQLAEAFELMKQHFDKRDESLDQRQMGIQYKLNQENADREDTIERRAMYIHAVDSETDFVHYEPTSIQKHKTLDEEFVSAKEQKSSESEEGNEQHNLDRFSKKNRTMILSQNPGATFVYGPQQWKLNGRKVREDEIDQPLIIIAPYKIEDTVVFEEICVYDISQTEAYQPTAAELEELLKKETAKGKSVAPRNVSRFQDRRKEMEMRKMVQSLRRSCENSLQHYLNERAYRELQYESQSNI